MRRPRDRQGWWVSCRTTISASSTAYSEFAVQSVGFWVQGPGLGMWNLGVRGEVLRVSGFRVEGWCV